MKKTVVIALFSSSLLLPVLGSSVAAQNIFEKGCEGVTDATLCEEAKQAPQNPIFGPDGIMADVLQFVTILAGIAAVIMTIIGGLQYITSSGDPAKISGAKNTLLYAFIGIVVVLFAQALVLFVIRRI